MEDAQLQVNAGKLGWCKKEVTFLGFMLIPTGYKPIKKQVDTILTISSPRNLRELCGNIEFYKKSHSQESRIN